MWKLHFAKRHLATVTPDAKWPHMWRVQMPDGQLSDMVNLTRAKDAARLLARQHNPECHDPALWNWRSGKSPPEPVKTDQNDRGYARLAAE